MIKIVNSYLQYLNTTPSEWIYPKLIFENYKVKAMQFLITEREK